MTDSSVDEFIKLYLEKRRLQQQRQAGYGVVEDEDDKSPYRVKNEKFRYVSNTEYMQPVNKNVSHSFMEFLEISKKTKFNPREPPGYYKHDPVHMVQALIIACNMEHGARSAASTIPQKGLQTLENNDTSRIIEYIKKNKEAREGVETCVEEHVYSLLTVDAITKNLPSHIKDLLSPVSVNNNNNNNNNK